MAILIVLLVYLLRDHGAQATEDTCFSSAICYKADMHETTWRKISPPPQCTQNPPTVESTKIIQIGRRLNRTIDRFFKRFAYNYCHACSFFEKDVSSANAFSDVERCFAPVVCQTDGMSRTDFIEIQPYLCTKDKKEADDILMQREKLFNASREYVAKALQKHLRDICNPGCLSSKIQQVAKQIEENNWKILKGPKQCFAPVVCSAGDSSYENWLKYPDCEYSAAILLSEEPENALSSILEVVFADMRKLIAKECNGKICKEGTITAQSIATTTQSTTKQADKINHQTTFAIKQGTSSHKNAAVSLKVYATTTMPLSRPTPDLLQTTAEPTRATTATEWLAVEHPDTTSQTTFSKLITADNDSDVRSISTTYHPDTTTNVLNTTGLCEIVIEGHCFWANFATGASVAFSKANEICSLAGGVLASIPTITAYDELSKYLRTKMPKRDGHHHAGARLGLTYSLKTKTFNGTSANLASKWNPGFPKPEDDRTTIVITIHSDPAEQNQGLKNIAPEQKRSGVVCQEMN